MGEGRKRMNLYHPCALILRNSEVRNLCRELLHSLFIHCFCLCSFTHGEIRIKIHNLLAFQFAADSHLFAETKACVISAHYWCSTAVCCCECEVMYTERRHLALTMVRVCRNRANKDLINGTAPAVTLAALYTKR